MGQSAGGMAVASLLVSAAAEGLFRQAVIASGIAPASAWPADQARARTEALAKRAGVQATRAGLASRTPLELIDAHDAVVAEYEAAGTPLMPRGDPSSTATSWPASSSTPCGPARARPSRS
jgi:para-nitrobenzyl esterase